jgi:cytoskeletal protein CcmA (bactofilin family)
MSHFPGGADTTIGKDSRFEGRFSIRGTLQIDGRYEGDRLSVDNLSVGPTGRVRTAITAANVVVEGVVIGNITATNRVLLLPTAKVLGDIRTPELIIQNGVILEGKCSISHPRTGSARTLIEEAYDA